MSKVIVDGEEIEICDKLPDGYLEVDTMDGFDEVKNEDNIERELLEDTMDLEGLLDGE